MVDGETKESVAELRYVFIFSTFRDRNRRNLDKNSMSRLIKVKKENKIRATASPPQECKQEMKKSLC